MEVIFDDVGFLVPRGPAQHGASDHDERGAFDMRDADGNVGKFRGFPAGGPYPEREVASYVGVFR
jgi:hypothetical protein